jgi:DNA polymerase V
VLPCAYDFEKARIVVLEMADAAALDLVEKKLLADQMVLTVVYDNDNLSDPAIREKYKGPVRKDWYGRPAPKPAHGTVNLEQHTSSCRRITDAVLDLYDRIVNPDLLVRRIYLATNHVIDEAELPKTKEKAQEAALAQANQNADDKMLTPENRAFLQKNFTGKNLSLNSQKSVEENQKEERQAA